MNEFLIKKIILKGDFYQQPPLQLMHHGNLQCRQEMEGRRL